MLFCLFEKQPGAFEASNDSISDIYTKQLHIILIALNNMTIFTYQVHLVVFCH